MAEPLSSTGTAIAGGAAGTAIGGWLVKLLVGREFKRNDQRHEAHETDIKALRERIDEVADGCVGEETIQALRSDFQAHRNEVNGRLDTIIGHLLKRGEK